MRDLAVRVVVASNLSDEDARTHLHARFLRDYPDGVYSYNEPLYVEALREHPEPGQTTWSATYRVE